MNKKITIFSEYSSKKGKGHFNRSKTMFNFLKSKFHKVSIFINKSEKFLTSKLKKTNNEIFIIDYKKYPLLKFNSKNKIILIDNKSRKKGIISINLLDTKKKRFHGPKWFPYPKSFFFKKKFNKKKYNLFICQGGTDAHNNLKKISKVLSLIDQNLINKCFIKNPKKKLDLKKIKFEVIQKKNFQKIEKIYKLTDIAITGCGNFSFELGFFGIPCVYTSTEKREIFLGKKFQNHNLGKFFSPNKTDKIAKEINKILTTKQYFESIRKRKRKFFYHDGLNNISNFIKKIN